jgi:small subunit ribosomal protein S16
MLKIRLNRQGVRNKPTYRVVVVEDSQKKGGKVVEVLGFWVPSRNTQKIERQRLNFWISKGATVSKALSRVLGK